MRPALALVLLAASACGSPGGANDAGQDAGSGGADAGDTTFADAWVLAHNAERANVMPAASPAIGPVTWSASLAATAQAWADRCQFVHSNNAYGENLYGGGGALNITPASVVSDWASEKADYTYSSNSCAAGQACGHYTQVVWRASGQIGCAKATCTINNPFGGPGSWQFWLCNYDPPGNYIGQRPY